MRFLSNPLTRTSGAAAVGGVLGALVQPMAIRYVREAAPTGAPAGTITKERIYFDSANKANQATTPASYVRWRLAGTVWSLGIGVLGIIAGWWMIAKTSMKAVGLAALTGGVVSATFGVARGLGLQFMKADTTGEFGGAAGGRVAQNVRSSGSLFSGQRVAQQPQRAASGGGTIPVLYTG